MYGIAIHGFKDPEGFIGLSRDLMSIKFHTLKPQNRDMNISTTIHRNNCG